MPDTFETAFKIAFPILFIVGWIFALRQLAWSSGWKDLAESYPAKDFAGTKRRFQSALVGRVQHNGILTIGANNNGLYLDVWFPFSAGHPPLYIPWTNVVRVHREKRFFTNFVVLTFADQPHAMLHLWPRTAKRLQEWSGGGFAVPV